MFCSQQLDFVIHFKIQVQRFAWCFEIFLNKISIFFHFWHLLMDYNFLNCWMNLFGCFQEWVAKVGVLLMAGVVASKAWVFRHLDTCHHQPSCQAGELETCPRKQIKRAEKKRDIARFGADFANHCWSSLGGPDAIWCVFHSVSVSSSFYVCQCVSTWWDCSWTLGELGLEAWFMVLLYFFWCCDQGWIVQASEGYLKQRLQARGCKRFQCFSVIQRAFFEDAGCIDRCGIGSHGHPKTSDSTWHLFPDMVEQHCPKFVHRCDPRWSQSCNLHSMWGKSRRA